jgi:hypothetical protein
MESPFLKSAIRQFETYKQLGEKTFAQLDEEQLSYQPNHESNSIFIIVKHLHGNMLSRWTDFLTSDGEKPWRKRDEEFEQQEPTRERMMTLWNEGWKCLFDALFLLTEEDIQKKIKIRGEEHSVMEAINRQMAHYPYHVGQIVYIAKMLADKNWKSLSIPRNGSAKFNEEMFRGKKD